jgi:hypothetical protein
MKKTRGQKSRATVPLSKLQEFKFFFFLTMYFVLPEYTSEFKKIKNSFCSVLRNIVFVKAFTVFSKNAMDVLCKKGQKNIFLPNFKLTKDVL